MKIPSKEIQQAIWGYYTEELPPSGSLREAYYDLLENDSSPETVKKLSESVKRQQATIEKNVIAPSVERSASKN